MVIVSLVEVPLGYIQHGATIYTLQLGFNQLFMPLFFSMERLVLGTLDLYVVTGLTAYLIYIWGQVDSTVGWLLAPYLVWLSFASYLATAIGVLNNWAFPKRAKSSTSKPQTAKSVNDKTY